MKTIHIPHPHGKTHKFTYSGFALGSSLLLFSLVYYIDLANTGFDPLSVYLFIVPGIALILRSMKPPMGFVRTITVLTGGALVGAFPMLFHQADDQTIWYAIAAGLIGGALLGGSFTMVYKKA